MTPTSANGSSQRPLATESISGRMETDTKVNGSIASNMDKVRTFLQMETPLPEFMFMENQKDKASTSGKMAAYI